jgi:hypothetical protein
MNLDLAALYSIGPFSKKAPPKTSVTEKVPPKRSGTEKILEKNSL